MKFLRRIPWYLIGGLLLGIILGLVYSWLISPIEYVDAAPSALRADFKDQYRALVALAYQADGNLGLAGARLEALGDGFLRHCRAVAADDAAARHEVSDRRQKHDRDQE